VCGWQPRDLGELLERRWTSLSAEQAADESSLFREPPAGARDDAELRLAPAAGVAVEQLVDLLARVRSERPEEPLWRGVRDWHTEAGEVVVRFNERLDPRDVMADDARVQCHLHDPGARALAERLRA
jgi:hypothetical protein